ncbi:beta-1,3-galactosyltransferase 5-like [Biomphalaria glabrata]|uniref:Hexosyltransferase n=1 Tax=Biomphalaria glabrata TaxID=6526 RepID=A0A9U8DZS1_BIOGL|nr:beta-1,3-galactosyltransferase 5-like [Biomphalaria glabrata]
MFQVFKKRKAIFLLGFTTVTFLINIYAYTSTRHRNVVNIKAQSLENNGSRKQTASHNFTITINWTNVNGTIKNESVQNDSLRETYRPTTQLTTALVSTGHEEAKSVFNTFGFMYKIVPIVDCSTSELVICVDGSRSNNHTRQTIRKTWGSYATVSSNKAALIFFLGSEHPSTSGSQSVQHFIDKEAELYGDILQEDYIDDYKNLTFKTLSILKWVTSRCPGSQFVLKADDDMYVNVPLLVQNLNNISQTKGKGYPFVVGYVFYNPQPIRNPASKWYASESQYTEKTYPRFTSGTAYAMTTSAAKLLYKASLDVPFFWLEDVYVTGLCAKKANVEVIHNNLFFNGKRNPTGCTFQNTITGHSYTTAEMERIHQQLFNITIKCH